MKERKMENGGERRESLLVLDVAWFLLAPLLFSFFLGTAYQYCLVDSDHIRILRCGD